MKKLIALCAVALSMGAFADSYLYWMVDNPVTWDTSISGTDNLKYSYVQIGVVDSREWQKGYLTMYNSDGTSANTTISALNGSGYKTSGYVSLGSQTTGYSYYIELLNDNLEFVGRSEYLSYSAAESYLANFSDGINPANAWGSGVTFTTAPVPEPTSGMLLLFGLAGLALRRKRA
jgi:hypothetical protein